LREKQAELTAFSRQLVEKNPQVREKKVAAATALLYIPRFACPK
jgi:hypothetical protein